MVNFEVKNLSFSYPEQQQPALKNINLTINQGQFVVICGKSGSGKSTLLRLLKPELSPKGKLEGETFFFGKERLDFSLRESSEKIGYMLQNAQYQAVTHCVRSELAFGLENLGLDSKTIRLRVAESAAYFSLEKIIDKKMSELSGGQKQLVCLASIIAMHPKVIILDEPTSQLDPISAATFLDSAYKLCKENAVTVIITEHRLENVASLADRIVILEDGKIINDSQSDSISRELFETNEFVGCSMPFPMKLHCALNLDGKLPLSVSQARTELEEAMNGNLLYTKAQREEIKLCEKIAVEMKNVRYAYDKSGYVLKNMSLKIKEGSFTAILGANGAGKTTAVSLMSGLLECKSGSIKIFDKDIKKYPASTLYGNILAVLVQNCESLFAGNTIKEDLENSLLSMKISKEEKEKKILEVSRETEITSLLSKHPYDISGGEMQRAALAMVLLKNPKIIFLDEPTKYVDSLFKKKFAKIIKSLCKRGITVIAVSHDSEFCAQYCDECAMIFDGTCILQQNKYDFFSQNYFYTTTANKISRDIFEDAVTQRQVLDLCKKNLQGLI